MNHLDLFSGIGGFALAAKRVWGADHEIAAFCEIDSFCQKVLRKNFPDIYIHDDIKTFTAHDFRGIDLVTAGFPCQPFSLAGERRGAADDRALWHEALRIIQEARPTWVVAENVTGIVSMELDRVCASLENSNYSVEIYNIPACAVGAPHRRQRIWIVANTNSERQQQPQGTISIIKRRSGNGSAWDEHWYNAASRVQRVYDGLPRGIHRHREKRLKALGNAIVPQVAEMIFQAIQIIEPKGTVPAMP